MNKVYVVLAGCMDDLSIEGIFSSERKSKSIYFGNDERRISSKHETLF